MYYIKLFGSRVSFNYYDLSFVPITHKTAAVYLSIIFIIGIFLLSLRKNNLSFEDRKKNILSVELTSILKAIAIMFVIANHVSVHLLGLNN